jgi:hypothetical protein
VLAISNTTGVAVQFAYDIGDIAEYGNALTFVGSTLYLASERDLWTIDTFSGMPTWVAEFSFSGFPGIDSYNILSMTTRPSDNKVFAILRDNSPDPRVTHLCTINVATGLVTNIGQNSNSLDGITWVPADYFQTSPG